MNGFSSIRNKSIFFTTTEPTELTESECQSKLIFFSMSSVVSVVALLFLLLFLGSLEAASPEQIDKRVHAHLLIADYPSACWEAYNGLQEYPHAKVLWTAYVRALAKAGDEKALMQTWKCLCERFPEEQCNRDLLEHLAWAVIDKGASSSSPPIRVFAMLGAFFSQDAKGVKILQQGLSDPNSFLRGAAVKLSSHLMDTALQDELLRMVQNETVWKVRLEVIHAIGEMKIGAAKKDLEAIIASDNSHMEEKAAAIKALIDLSEGINPKQLQELIGSNRAGMRMLACELVMFFDQPEEAELLLPLIEDPHADVRRKVLQTMGRLRMETIAGHSVASLAERAANDPDPAVAITAAWVLTIHHPQKGMSHFRRFLDHSSRDIRYLAAAALAATGSYGLSLTKQAFKDSKDPYVKMNLAIGLIGQREESAAACDCLFAGLSEKKERWSWEENGFRVLVPGKVKHDEGIPNYPEAVNQLTRLEVLQMLAVMQYPYVQQAVKQFLQERHWGVSGIASALLLTEGDDEAVEVVQGLLKDNDPQVKVQAALILALWGQGDDVVQLLQEAYATADRDLKGQILEGVGRVGSENSLPFLAERLQEPYQTLRIIAAAALLECLYR